MATTRSTYLPITLLLLAAADVLAGSSLPPQQQPLTKSTCTHPASSIHIFSHSPLVLYISNFITPDERAHLQAITKHTFTPSAVANDTGHQGRHATRTSTSSQIPRDPIAHCIETRALRIQGLHTARAQLEPLQLVQYGPNETYHLHTDWFSDASSTTAAYGGNRASSFFAYVATSPDLTGGGTNFPLLDAPRGEEWCEFVDCDEPWENGVTFRPVEGNAVFWRNLDEEGRGLETMVHAGLPVVSGRKVGMNIWTREGPMSEEVRGVDDELL